MLAKNARNIASQFELRMGLSLAAIFNVLSDVLLT